MFDFNTVEGNGSGFSTFRVIPEDSIVPVVISLERSKYGSLNEPYIEESKRGLKRLSLKFTVGAGTFKDTKWFMNIALPVGAQGMLDSGQKKAAEIGGRQLRALLSAGRQVSVNDRTPEADRKRVINDWRDFDGLKLWVVVGYEERNGKVFNTTKDVVDVADVRMSELRRSLEIISDAKVPEAKQTDAVSNATVDETIPF